MRELEIYVCVPEESLPLYLMVDTRRLGFKVLGVEVYSNNTEIQIDWGNQIGVSLCLSCSTKRHKEIDWDNVYSGLST